MNKRICKICCKDIEGEECSDCKNNKDLLPPLAMAEVIAVLKDGAEKHPDWGWVNRDDEVDFAALERHFQSYKDKVFIDHDSGRRALAHIISRASFLLNKELARELAKGRVI